MHQLTLTPTRVCTHTYITYPYLRTRGCYIADGICLAFFLCITWSTAYGHLLSLLNGVPLIVVLSPAVEEFVASTLGQENTLVKHTHAHTQRHPLTLTRVLTHTIVTCISGSEVALSLIVSEPSSFTSNPHTGVRIIPA